MPYGATLRSEPSHREVEAVRWAATAHGAQQVVAHRERERAVGVGS
jgi:hypothetical protein